MFNEPIDRDRSVFHNSELRCYIYSRLLYIILCIFYYNYKRRDTRRRTLTTVYSLYIILGGILNLVTEVCDNNTT